MKQLIFQTLLSLILLNNSYSQSDQQIWESALYCYRSNNCKIHLTKIELFDSRCSNNEEQEVTQFLLSKEGIIDVKCIEGKSWQLYHFSTIDKNLFYYAFINFQNKMYVESPKILNESDILFIMKE